METGGGCIQVPRARRPESWPGEAGESPLARGSLSPTADLHGLGGAPLLSFVTVSLIRGSHGVQSGGYRSAFAVRSQVRVPTAALWSRNISTFPELPLPSRRWQPLPPPAHFVSLRTYFLECFTCMEPPAVCGLCVYWFQSRCRWHPALGFQSPTIQAAVACPGRTGGAAGAPAFPAPSLSLVAPTFSLLCARRLGEPLRSKETSLEHQRRMLRCTRSRKHLFTSYFSD